MCFKITDSVKYATKPIKVYKKLCIEDDIYSSPFRNYEWKIGELVRADFSFMQPREESALNSEEYLLINEIYSPSYFYFFSKSKVLIKDVINTKYIAEGLHSYTSKEEAEFLPLGKVIAECEIPKHSWYYINDIGECVSDQLIIKKIL